MVRAVCSNFAFGGGRGGRGTWGILKREVSQLQAASEGALEDNVKKLLGNFKGEGGTRLRHK